MPVITFSQLMQWTPGILSSDVPQSPSFAGVQIDSRKVQPGDLFFALPGTLSDGHQFLTHAQEAGAVAAVVQKGFTLPHDLPNTFPLWIVEDSLQALESLSRGWLKHLSPTVIGITGSLGKTTAKEFLAHFLRADGARVSASPASYNSETGLPLSILSAQFPCDFLVLEFGVNAIGEMEDRLQVCQPEHAWLTTVSPVHLEGMHSVEEIYAEKKQLLAAASGHTLEEQAIFQNGVAQVLNSESGAWRINVHPVGELFIPVLAQHEAELVASAVYLAHALGISGTALQERTTSLPSLRGRLELHMLDQITVLDDAYNASPAAMKAAFLTLQSLPQTGRRVAVLGEMHELGASSQALHEQVGEDLFDLGIPLLFALGTAGQWMAEAFEARGGTAFRADSILSLQALLHEELQSQDVVLLKASRAERLEQLLPQFHSLPFQRCIS